GKQIGCPVGVFKSPATGFGGAEASEDFVHDEDCTVVGGDVAQERVKARLRLYHAHIGRGRFGDDTGDLVGILFERLFDDLFVVIRQHQRLAGDRFGHTGGIWQCVSGQPGTCSSQQAVGMSVVATGELDDEVTSSGTAG